ncbi:MAG: hypothetical protein RIT02_3846 [Planctomycetota bacterium]|jgi:hypothetical protein
MFGLALFFQAQLCLLLQFALAFVFASLVTHCGFSFKKTELWFDPVRAARVAAASVDALMAVMSEFRNLGYVLTSKLPASVSRTLVVSDVAASEVLAGCFAFQPDRGFAAWFSERT